MSRRGIESEETSLMIEDEVREGHLLEKCPPSFQ